MARLAAIFLLFGVVFVDAAVDLEMKLTSQHNKLYLRVTVYQDREEFAPAKINCRSRNVEQLHNHRDGGGTQSRRLDLKPYNNNNRAKSANTKAPANFNYEVIIEANGFVECRFENISSNVPFYRMENQHMFVVKIKDAKEEETTTLARKLQLVLNNEFRVSEMAPQKNVFHLTSKEYGAMTPENDAKLWKQLATLLKNQTSLKIGAVLSTKYCMEHDEDGLLLPITPRNKIFRPMDCVQENLTPFSVHCRGDFYQGVYWDPAELENYKISPRIYDLNLTKNAANATSLNSPLNIQTFCDNLGDLNVTKMSVIGARFDDLVGSSLLVSMKSSLNTSNELLDYLDKALVNAEKLENGTGQVVRPRFAARVQNVSTSKTAGAGFAIFESASAFANEGFSNFNKNETTTIITEAPSAALLLPDSLLDAEGAKEKVVVAVFKEGAALFDANTSTSPVISVTIGAKSFEQLEDPVKIWFRRDVRARPEPGTCMSWDFGANNGNGAWSPYGCRLQKTFPSNKNNWTVIDECACWHMTHFGEIFWDSDRPFFTVKDSDHESLLNFITFSGCIVSLAGLTGVFLTAAISPTWLSGPGQKIQLQMSVNLALLIIFFMLLTTSSVKIPKAVGSLMGALLHYIMLSNFSWMLLAAYLQYSRLVKVVSKRSSRLLLKSGVIGWGLPLIPVVLTFITGNFQLYAKPPLFLPTGAGFYMTIFAPLLAIVTCNLVVFILIARSLYQTIEIRRHDVTCLNTVRIKQLVFLFVLLGLSWVFAVLQVAVPALRIFFAYLFCFSVGAQGVVYFVFFVLMDTKATDAWTRPFRNSALKYDVHKLTRRAGLVYSTRSSSYSSTSSSRVPLDISTSPA